MTTSDELLKQYQKWFEIALFENRMIQEKKWGDLPTCARQKEEIMQGIRGLESKDIRWRENQSAALRLLIHQLADLEQQNHLLLRERMAEMKVQIDDSARRVRMVRQLGRRYQEGGRGGGRHVSRQA